MGIFKDGIFESVSRGVWSSGSYLTSADNSSSRVTAFALTRIAHHIAPFGTDSFIMANGDDCLEDGRLRRRGIDVSAAYRALGKPLKELTNHPEDFEFCSNH